MLVQLGVYEFVEMVIFVSILAVGLIYAWKKGSSLEEITWAREDAQTPARKWWGGSRKDSPPRAVSRNILAKELGG